MRKYFILLIVIFGLNHATAQELLAEVNVDFSQIQGSNTSAYTALEKSLREFINTTSWTDSNFKIHEKIECNFTIVIRERDGSNRYTANLLVQSRRPVFGSNYYTPILNINDTDFSFEYTESEQLIFNPRRFSEKNLTDVIGFYIYMVLGYDADTFARNGGTKYFETAQQISGMASNSQFSGWSTMSGPRSRSGLINEILNSKNNTLRAVYYTYHRLGLDVMGKNELNAKNIIGNALLSLENYQTTNNYTQNYPLDLFFQAKKTEISQIFGDGLKPNLQMPKLKSLLNTISPSNSNQWNSIQ